MASASAAGSPRRQSRQSTPSVKSSRAAGESPVITGFPAARELLTDGVDCLLCRRGDPAALADAILRLRNDGAMAERLALAGRRRFQEKASPAVIGRELLERLREWEGRREHAA